jgi:hypothetical protein
VDVFEPGPGEPIQIHDLNPTLPPPTGLFWTIPMPGGGVDVNLGAGRAVMRIANAPVYDFGDFGNAVLGLAPPVPARVSCAVEWSGVSERVQVSNPAQGFGGEFVRNTARMAWTATAGDYRFVSDPLSSSSSAFAELGHERNGLYFRGTA